MDRATGLKKTDLKICASAPKIQAFLDNRFPSS